MADAKRQLEAFRARQYAGPHPAVAAQQRQQASGAMAAASAQHPQAASAAAAGGARAAGPAAPAAGPAAEPTEPDTGRCVLHLDIDCFYAQVEEVSWCGSSRARHDNQLYPH